MVLPTGVPVWLVTRYDDDCGQVRIDPGQLDQVVLNLILNACDAMGDGGTLRLGLRKVFLAQADDGLPGGDYVERYTQRWRLE